MANKTETNKIEKEAIKLTEKILKMLVVDANVTVETEDDLVKIKIDGSDLGLLIGYRGENLEGLQLLIGVILNKKIGAESWQHVLVDVGGWQQQREEALRVLVDREVAKMPSAGSFVELPSMPPAQRRTVHILVKQYPGLTSESDGEGTSRHVVIKRLKKG